MLRRYIVLAVLTAAATLAQGQTKSGNVTWSTSQSGKHVFVAKTISDVGGDVRFEGAPVKGAPYSAEAVTETVQKLADGNNIRHENHTTIQRDSEGRTRREETLESVGPWSTSQPHKMIFINDPVAKVQYILNPDDKTGRKIPAPEIAEFLDPPTKDVSEDVLIQASPGTPAPLPPPPPPPPGATATFEQRVIVEDGGPHTIAGTTGPGPGAVFYRSFNTDKANEEALGKRMVEGLECVGTKFTTVLKAEEIGADRDVEIAFERWTSPELGVDVLTKRTDPRFGETTYRLTNINRAEPLASAFEPPADYEITSGGDAVFIRREPAPAR